MSLARVLMIIGLANLATFGNGPVMIPILQQQLVVDLGILRVDELLYAFTIARVTPGQANLYVVSIGWMLFGAAGAVLAAAVIAAPAYLVIPAVSLHRRAEGVALVRGFTRGVVAVSVGLIVATAVEMGAQALAGWLPWAVFGLALVCVQVLAWHPLVALGVSSAAGALMGLALGVI